ncbi:PTS transporter subunit EIIC [Holdemania filiformis]|uniref:PTS beta-glucoside transporter subunit IIABC n=1 Tax=Holdemania filiformis TaxID=61171 RepID=A0A412G586_9FIRM|nr:PTS transporter subunit EIIC [Holdemania filiformis]MBS5000271.1 PTS transporter subunit EIIC [Holdemania filiformis]RGR75944.1 hypothetical protein DWY25_04180 [Holdemania filiformis]
MVKDVKQATAEIIAAAGGKENIAAATHCMTRLRLNLKDEGLSSDEAINKIEGVISVVHAGGQVQVVIGQGVDKVYDELCRIAGFETQNRISEDLDNVKTKEKLTPKSVINSMMGALSGSITPILPIFIAAGIFKMIAVLFGPKNFGLLTETSHLFMLCNIVGSAGYYFLPFYAAYSAAKKFNCNPIMALLFAGVMLHPDMLAIVSSGEAFTVYGIPMKLVSYVQAVIPMVLIVWAMSYVEKWLKKVLPNMVRTIGLPVLTMAIMLPVGLCVLGPVCTIIMGWIADLIVWLSSTVGILAMVVVAVLWPLVISFGMHVPVMTALLPAWMEMGFDAIVSPATIAQSMAAIGAELGYALRSDGVENRSLGWSCFVTNVTANIGEPWLYGIYLRDKKAMLWHAIGAASGALTMGLLGAKVVMFSGVGFPWLNPLRFGEDMILGAIGCIVAFAVSLTLSLLFGFTKKDA